jgi:hypothetical protein
MKSIPAFTMIIKDGIVFAYNTGRTPQQQTIHSSLVVTDDPGVMFMEADARSQANQGAECRLYQLHADQVQQSDLRWWIWEVPNDA